MKSSYFLVLHLMDMLLEWNECIAKPVSWELLHRAGDYVIAGSFRGAMGVLMVDSELSTPSFYGAC